MQIVDDFSRGRAAGQTMGDENKNRRTVEKLGHHVNIMCKKIEEGRLFLNAVKKS